MFREKNKFYPIFAIAVILAMVVLTACSPKSKSTTPVVAPTPVAAPTATQVVNVAFVLLWECSDNGWSASHCRGIQELRQSGEVVAETENSFDVRIPDGRVVHVVWVEKAGDSSDSGRIIRDFAVKGYDLIFATTFGQMDYALETAAEFPNVAMEHCSGYKVASNMNWYMARNEHSAFVSGYATGLMGYHKIGIVGTNPIPEVIRDIDAFTKGVQKGLQESGHSDWAAASDVTTVVWLNSWRDAEGETTVAQQFAKGGFDAVRQMADTPDSSIAACKAGVKAVGYGMNVANYGADCAFVSTTWVWGPYYRRQVQAFLAGTWKGGQTHYGGLGDAPQPMAGLEGWNVPEDIRAKAIALAEQIAKAERDAVAQGKDVAESDGIFSGPIYDQAGELVVPQGQSLDDEYLLSKMTWLIKGAKGQVPK